MSARKTKEKGMLPFWVKGAFCVLIGKENRRLLACGFRKQTVACLPMTLVDSCAIVIGTSEPKNQ